MMSLRGEADWSPPFLCALIAYAIHLSFLFETVLQDAGKTHPKYANNVKTKWIWWLVQDSLDFWDSQKFEHYDAVVRYLMEEGILYTLHLAIGNDDEERKAFISRCEPDSDYIFPGNIRGVVHLLEDKRLEFGIEASEPWKALVDDLNLVYPIDDIRTGNEIA